MNTKQLAASLLSAQERARTAQLRANDADKKADNARVQARLAKLKLKQARRHSKLAKKAARKAKLRAKSLREIADAALKAAAKIEKKAARSLKKKSAKSASPNPPAKTPVTQARSRSKPAPARPPVARRVPLRVRKPSSANTAISTVGKAQPGPTTAPNRQLDSPPAALPASNS